MSFMRVACFAVSKSFKQEINTIYSSYYIYFRLGFQFPFPSPHDCLLVVQNFLTWTWIPKHKMKNISIIIMVLYILYSIYEQIVCMEFVYGINSNITHPPFEQPHSAKPCDNNLLFCINVRSSRILTGITAAYWFIYVYNFIYYCMKYIA